MSNAEQIVYDKLSKSTALVAYVGDRIREWTKGQAIELPNVTYYVIPGGRYFNDLRGDTGAGKVVVQIECSSTDAAECEAIALIIRKALRRVGTYIDKRKSEDQERDIFDISQDFRIHEQEDLES